MDSKSPPFSQIIDEALNVSETDRLRAINAELLQLAHAVVAHFADTDAPLGQQARAAIAAAIGDAK